MHYFMFPLINQPNSNYNSNSNTNTKTNTKTKTKTNTNTKEVQNIASCVAFSVFNPSKYCLYILLIHYLLFQS